MSRANSAGETKVRKGAGSMGPLARDGGGTAVVIGGGPGGVAAAVAIQREARALGRRARVIIVEGKRFSPEGHYNQCTGVLAPPIIELMERDLEVPFPYHLSRAVVSGYVLHMREREIMLEGESESPVSLRRVQFDAYMLEAARERGIEIVSARVTGVEFHAERTLVYTESGSLEADVMIGAFGLDEGAGAIFQEAVGYRPPPALSSIVTKYHPGEAAMTGFGSCIRAFLPPAAGIEFGAVTPKGNHLTINIAGVNADSALMTHFLNLPEVRRALPNLDAAGSLDPGDLRRFKGRFPRGLAGRFYGDRFVMVGDAAGLVRAFKGKGVTTAILTGIRAARVIARDGFSARAFASYRAANRDIISDLPYGQAMRRFTILAARTGLMDAIVEAAQKNTGLRRALFDAVSATHSYRDALREGLTPASTLAVIAAFFRQRFSGRPAPLPPAQDIPASRADGQSRMNTDTHR